MNDKVRIGFVGVGTMGQMAHLRNYVTIDDCEVVALAEMRAETGKRVAQRYGVPRTYASHSDMLAAEELDGIVACQQFITHETLLPELYEKTRYVFTEKPLALGLQTGRKLAAAASAAGCTHMVGYHKRSDPATIYAKNVVDGWLAGGEMGALRYVRITMPPGEWTQGGFIGLVNAGDQAPALKRESTPADIGEDVAEEYWKFVNYYIHQINLLRHFLGESYKVTFADKGGVLFVAESASGVTGVVEMAPYRTTVAWEEKVLVAFQKGYVEVDLPAPMVLNRPGTVRVYSDPGGGAEPQRIEPALPWVHAMRQQAIHFLKVCRNEMAPPCDATEAVEDLDVAGQYIRLHHGK